MRYLRRQTWLGTRPGHTVDTAASKGESTTRHNVDTTRRKHREAQRAMSCTLTWAGRDAPASGCAPIQSRKGRSGERPARCVSGGSIHTERSAFGSGLSGLSLDRTVGSC